MVKLWNGGHVIVMRCIMSNLYQIVIVMGITQRC